MKNSSDSLTTGILAMAAVIGTILLLGGLFLYGAWAGAFVATHLWTWYVMPAFGVASLKMIHAYGISLLISYWTYHYRAQHTKDERTTSKKIAEVIMFMCYPWMVLFLGWMGVVLFM
jgi:disulfide bond formation protein DsbB